MVCGLTGIAVALILRVIFLLTGIDTLLSFRLFTYVALAACRVGHFEGYKAEADPAYAA